MKDLKNTITILTVDDDEDNLEVVATLLSPFDYIIEKAINADVALNYIEKHGPPTLILLDVMMPGMSGLDCCKEIRKKYSIGELPILLLTARTRQEDIVQGFEVGANDYITKPISKKEFLSRVNTHLQLNHAVREIAFINKKIENMINTRIKLEQEKEIAIRANQAKSIFISSISHEIKTPLNAILGYSQVLEIDPVIKATNERSQILYKIKKAANKLLDIFDNLLNLSKLESGKLVVDKNIFNFTDLLKNISKEYMPKCEEKGLIWQLDLFEEHDLYVLGDQAKLRQVLSHLVENAVKFTNSGKIILKIIDNKNNNFSFEIIDTGIGISKEILDKIFSPTNYLIQGAIGINLALTIKQIELMGGQLNIESSSGKGTKCCFSLSLDIIDNSSIDLSLPLNTKVSALIVEDIEDNLLVIASIMRMLGCNVYEATNNTDAAKIIQSNYLDLLFINIDSQTFDSSALLNTATLVNEKIIKIAISSLAYKDNTFDASLNKPFNFNDIFHIIEEKLHIKLVNRLEQQKFEAKNATATTQNILSTKIILPEKYHQPLYQAVRLKMLTNIKAILAELENDPAISKSTVELLKELVNNYNFKELLNLLEK